MDPITITPIAGALGAEIDGVDISKGLDRETVQALRQALLDHLVIFFRDQDLTPDSYLAFANEFGTPTEYPLMKGIEGYPFIQKIEKLPSQRWNFAGTWHSDTTYLDCPPSATLLQAVELPPFGGDTMYANQYLAYETLSEPLRRFVDGLTAVHISTKSVHSKTLEDTIRASRGNQSHAYVAQHPAVRTHPETGRKSLYIDFAHTSHFEGMTEEESAPILEYLFQHQVRPEFTCRFAWRKGSVALWDNRCTLHVGVNDYQGFGRRMHRITLAGERPH